MKHLLSVSILLSHERTILKGVGEPLSACKLVPLARNVPRGRGRIGFQPTTSLRSQ